MSSGRNITDHDFYCTRCGKKGIPVCRTGRNRETGHLKKLYCIHCGIQTNHAECISGTKYSKEDFIKEFEAGNFNDEGLRIVALEEWQANLKSKDIIETQEQEISIEEWMSIFGCAI